VPSGPRKTEALPLILLVIRMAFKEDLQASVAELVYGDLLTPTDDPVDTVMFTTRSSTVNKDIPHKGMITRTGSNY
jgi:hypothetical protein